MSYRHVILEPAVPPMRTGWPGLTPGQVERRVNRESLVRLLAARGERPMFAGMGKKTLVALLAVAMLAVVPVGG
jgi:hypothetical protein